jgi:hypothetical protein
LENNERQRTQPRITAFPRSLVLGDCLHEGRDEMPNDPSSATRRRGRNDCNRDAPAGFAAAHG